MDEFLDLESRIEKLEKDLQSVHERNRRVSLDKAWEESVTRRLLICACTYLITAVVFYLIGIPAALRNALIPTLAYFLSTLSLQRVKARWIAKNDSC